MAAEEIASKHTKKHLTASTNMFFPSTSNKDMNNREIAPTLEARQRGGDVFG